MMLEPLDSNVRCRKQVAFPALVSHESTLSSTQRLTQRALLFHDGSETS